MKAESLMLTLALYAQLISTICMTGLIWFVQIVHYPLFAYVGADQFSKYEQVHQNLTTIVVGPAMLVEVLAAGLLLWLRPENLPAWMLWSGMLCVVVIWGVTAIVSVPLHTKLALAFDEKKHFLLVQSNWIRTILWSFRTGLACLMVHQCLSGH